MARMHIEPPLLNMGFGLVVYNKQSLSSQLHKTRPNMPRSGISIAQDSVSRLGLCVFSYDTYTHNSIVPLPPPAGEAVTFMSIVSSAEYTFGATLASFSSVPPVLPIVEPSI